MEITPKKISFQKNLNEKINYYIEDDQLRLLFIVILLIGIILLISGTKGAYLFLFIGFVLLIFVWFYRYKDEPLPAPKQKGVSVEHFVCKPLDLSHLRTPPISMVSEEMRVDSVEQKCQIKFKNSLRNKK